MINHVHADVWNENTDQCQVINSQNISQEIERNFTCRRFELCVAYYLYVCFVSHPFHFSIYLALPSLSIYLSICIDNRQIQSVKSFDLIPQAMKLMDSLVTESNKRTWTNLRFYKYIQTHFTRLIRIWFRFCGKRIYNHAMCMYWYLIQVVLAYGSDILASLNFNKPIQFTRVIYSSCPLKIRTIRSCELFLHPKINFLK